MFLLMSFIHSGLTEVKSVVKVTPDQLVFRGETVTLTCDIQGEGNKQWTYSWFKDGDTDEPFTTTTEAEFRLSPADMSNSGEYSCEANRINISAAVTLHVSVKPVVKVTPNQPVFRGETVTLTCDIQGEENDQWTYSWFKDGNTDEPFAKTTEAEFSPSLADMSNSGKYRCEAKRSDISAAVTLTVSDLPTSTLTVTPDSPVFTGETVNLKCVIKSDHSGWRYKWYKGSKVKNVMLKDSQYYIVNIDTLTIKGVIASDQGQYWCRGQIAGRPKTLHSSSAVNLSVMERPKPVVKVTPDQRVFRGETVTLTCDIQGGGNIQWTHSWFKDGYTHNPYITTTTAEFSFRADSVSDSGEYSCRGERSDSQRSDISAAVTLTVSDLPTSTLTVTPDSPVFTGETVNLKCVIKSDHNDWRYEWYKGSKDNNVMLKDPQHYIVNTDTLTIKGVIASDQGYYWCRGDIDGRPESLHFSSDLYIYVIDSPTSTLTVTPDSPVFTGETVNLKCEIESYSYWRSRNGLTHEWRYEWYKGNRDNSMLQTSVRYSVSRDTLTIRGATESDQDQYWCKGQRNTNERPKSSRLSSAVSLTVKDLPTSTLNVTPDSPVFTGETVNLTCVIESYSDWRQRNDLTNDLRSDWTPERWRYEWYKSTDSVMLQMSDRYTVNKDNLTIRGVKKSDAGQYTCKGQRDGRPKSSQSSSAFFLSVTDLPTSTLNVTPDSPVFTGETVNLTCVIESYSDWRQRNDLTNDLRSDWTPERWRYEWYKSTDSVMLQMSDRYTVNKDNLTIRGVKKSDAGQYTCKGQRDGRPKSSQSSSAFFLSVTDLPTSTLTVTPDSPVFTGETVNLTCVIESNHSNWRYEWYKGTNNSVMLQTSERYTVSRDTLTIRGATESDQDQYRCRGQRDERPKSSQKSKQINLSVNASTSLLVTGVVVGLSVSLLIFISLVLLWRYKKNKASDQQRNVNQTSDPNQSAESQPENSPLQSAGSDHVYDDVTTVKNRDKAGSDNIYDDVTIANNGETDVTYSEVTVKKKMDKDDVIGETNNVTYSEVGKKGKKCKSKDINIAEPSDLTYAQINTQDKKNTKGKGAGLADIMIEMKSKQKHKGKSSESGDTFYSELKHNTDRDADAGVDATYAQPIRKKNKTHADAGVDDATYAQPIRKKNKTRP
ncbi:basement membrane-specific heparan sulfate proteoglycan core protein isoform X4 [Labeo rohita]|uniref:basement membrane-specific heparan sulfate proteoglycan core protein isoform X4 n=1 Tax=Labeo rohita TaxID=84645 RepID=UPI0021E319DD|nr:basement membrane-specific heparan sulfate proteoglycan core protein isoform X4 [Labeo rohita]